MAISLIDPDVEKKSKENNFYQKKQKMYDSIRNGMGQSYEPVLPTANDVEEQPAIDPSAPFSSGGANMPSYNTGNLFSNR